MDRSASITISDLEKEWQTWNHNERMDFCGSISFVSQPLLSDILLFIFKQSDVSAKKQCANLVALNLSKELSVPLLVGLLKESRPGDCANIYQALANTEDPSVLGCLEESNKVLWRIDGINLKEESINHIAYDAICCLDAIMRLGGDPLVYDQCYRGLKEHADVRIREHAEILVKYFERGKDKESRK